MTKFKENEYKFVKYFNHDDDITEGEARQQAMYVFIPTFFKSKICFILVLNVTKINVIIYLLWIL
jgi:hypothetical protein